MTFPSKFDASVVEEQFDLGKTLRQMRRIMLAIGHRLDTEQQAVQFADRHEVECALCHNKAVVAPVELIGGRVVYVTTYPPGPCLHGTPRKR